MYDKPKGIIDVIKHDFITDDIITLILYANKEAIKEQGLQRLAKSLERENELNTCKAIYDYVKQHISYIRDTKHEDVKSPRATLRDSFGDCKSMSLLVGSLLYENNISFYFRFTAYNGNPHYTHVYIVTTSNIVIDCVHTSFNQEVKYSKKIDYLGYSAINGTQIYTWYRTPKSVI